MNNFGPYILYLFIINSYFCEGRLPYKHKKSTESSRSVTKNLTLSKRDLEDGIEDDAGDLFSPIERESFIRRDDAATLPVSALNKSGHACWCHGRNRNEATTITARTNEFKKKSVASRLLKGNVRGRTSELKISSKKQSAATGSAFLTRSTTTATIGPVKMVLNMNHFELKESEFQPLVAIKKVCPYYKEIPELDILKIADVWQLIYYKSQQKITCFKMFLKKITPESRKKYEEKFGSFNETINWNKYLLELTSIGKPREDKKHFLQGAKKNGGILENIVLTEEIANDTRIITLQEQSPDQWLVTKNLLIMRDCDNGDVVIFNRIPYPLSTREIAQAMTKFGEDGINETEPCVEPSSSNENDFERDSKFEILS